MFKALSMGAQHATTSETTAILIIRITLTGHSSVDGASRNHAWVKYHDCVNHGWIHNHHNASVMLSA